MGGRRLALPPQQRLFERGVASRAVLAHKLRAASEREELTPIGAHLVEDAHLEVVDVVLAVVAVALRRAGAAWSVEWL